MTTKTHTKPVETFTAVRDMAFDTAIADHELALQIRKAGRTDDRTQREFKAGRIMRGLLKGKAMAEYLTAGDNTRATIRAELAAQAYAILDKKGYLNPDKDGLKPEITKDIRQQMRDNTRRNKSEQAVEAAARKAWSRFCADHGLVQASTKAGNANAAKPKAKRQTQGAVEQVTTTRAEQKAEKATVDAGAKAARVHAIPAQQLVPAFASPAEVDAHMEYLSAQMSQMLSKGKHVCKRHRAVLLAFVEGVAHMHDE